MASGVLASPRPTCTTAVPTPASGSATAPAIPSAAPLANPLPPSWNAPTAGAATSPTSPAARPFPADLSPLLRPAAASRGRRRENSSPGPASGRLPRSPAAPPPPAGSSPYTVPIPLRRPAARLQAVASLLSGRGARYSWWGGAELKPLFFHFHFARPRGSTGSVPPPGQLHARVHRITSPQAVPRIAAAPLGKLPPRYGREGAGDQVQDLQAREGANPGRQRRDGVGARVQVRERRPHLPEAGRQRPREDAPSPTPGVGERAARS